MISVKEYADSRGKSIQAVHQQRKRQKYKEKLIGHEIIQDGVVFLDEKAVEILDSAHDTTVAVVDTSTKEKIQKLEKDLEAMKNREKNLMNEIAKKNNSIIELQSKMQQQTEHMTALLLENKEKTLLLEQKDEQITQIEELKSENDRLKEENDHLLEKVETQSKSEGQNEPKKGFFARLFGR